MQSCCGLVEGDGPETTWCVDGQGTVECMGKAGCWCQAGWRAVLGSRKRIMGWSMVCLEGVSAGLVLEGASVRASWSWRLVATWTRHGMVRWKATLQVVWANRHGLVCCSVAVCLCGVYRLFVHGDGAVCVQGASPCNVKRGKSNGHWALW